MVSKKDFVKKVPLQLAFKWEVTYCLDDLELKEYT